MDQMSLNDENPLCWNLALTFRDTGSCIDPSALGIAINAVALFTGARFPSRINLSLSLSLSLMIFLAGACPPAPPHMSTPCTGMMLMFIAISARDESSKGGQKRSGCAYT